MQVQAFSHPYLAHPSVVITEAVAKSDLESELVQVHRYGTISVVSHLDCLGQIGCA